MKTTIAPYNFVFTGPYANLCEQFMNHKRALGFKYYEGGQWLRMFDNYCHRTCGSIPPAPGKTLINGFLSTLSYLAPKSKSNILTVLRQFGLFLSDLKYEVYTPPMERAKPSSFVPYIYTSDELKRLFCNADHLKVNLRSPYMHAVLPVIIRMLYGCGLRISEAVGLLKTDVNLENGILIVREAKFDKDRLIPMADSLISVCRQYVKNPSIIDAKSQYFFPAPDGGRLSTSTIRERFHTMLFQTRIGHGGKVRPRLHDLRHTFAVNCLRQWVKFGQDIMTTLPILATYLGHEDIKCTGRYLRLTPEVFPEITTLMSKTYSGIFQEGTDA